MVVGGDDLYSMSDNDIVELVGFVRFACFCTGIVLCGEPKLRRLPKVRKGTRATLSKCEMDQRQNQARAFVFVISLKREIKFNP